MASTSHAIEQQPFRWDCNGFYRRLGVSPYATRREIAAAFLDIDGHSSSSLTDAAMVLLDKSARQAYDLMPLGTFWASDENLVQGAIEGDFESAIDVDMGWAVYVDSMSADAIDHEAIDVWRWMIAWLLWRAKSPVEGFAMGISDSFGVAIVGFRIVAFVPLDSKPAWEYVRDLAAALQDLVEGPATLSNSAPSNPFTHSTRK